LQLHRQAVSKAAVPCQWLHLIRLIKALMTSAMLRGGHGIE